MKNEKLDLKVKKLIEKEACRIVLDISAGANGFNSVTINIPDGIVTI